MNLNWHQIIGALVIAATTWTASQFFSAQSSISVIQIQIEQMSSVLKEIRNEQKNFALKSELDKIERRVEKLEQK